MIFVPLHLMFVICIQFLYAYYFLILILIRLWFLSRYVGKFVRKCDRVLSGPDARYTNLYMKNLDLDITEATLQEKFSSFGKIVSLGITKDNNGMSRGFGFVNYENPDDAKRALEAMNGTQLGSSFVLLLCRLSEGNVETSWCITPYIIWFWCVLNRF